MSSLKLSNVHLGGGEFSCVFKGLLEDKQVAVKRIPLTENGSENEGQELAKLDHINVIRLLKFEKDAVHK